ncbi:pilus assembly protein [Streptomyces sp. A0642]|uniref:TadE family protein n=1 Tax=Streptomyces sp. A0642 TaxID=2563100 RepID=UPI0010A29DEA|nr:TadE family protein [Streptomyces sp. A0642]THA73031.1 pilus assembly protein [Streptomyces sp. A0642]
MATIEMADGRIGGRRERDRGQTAIEFVGVTPLIILMLIVLWQCALIGYTYILAGNSADVAARAGNGSQSRQDAACKEAARKDLPDAWQGDVEIDCGAEWGLYRAKVTLEVPVLVPGVLNFPMDVEGNAASAKEG